MTGEKLAGTMLQKKRGLLKTNLLFPDDSCESDQHAPPMGKSDRTHDDCSVTLEYASAHLLYFVHARETFPPQFQCGSDIAEGDPY
jgi:hypothetical protein